MRLCLLLTLTLLCLPPVLPGQDHPPARWPQFRGPGGRAVADEGPALPVEFGPGKNVLWKTPLPEGFSSPCVWGGRVFLTGFDPAAQKLETLCLDRGTGKILWRRTAPADRIERVYKVNSPASATPATDGQRVYVSFGSYGLLCYDFDGRELWRRPLPTPRTSFGTGTSPVLAGGLLLLNGQGNDLKLMAFDPATGKTVWETEPPPFPSDYPTPLLWEHDSVTEVIIPGRGGLLAYDLQDGSRRWWIPGLGRECETSPALGNGLLFVASHVPGGDPEMRLNLPEWQELVKNDRDGDNKLSRQEMPTDRLIFSRGGEDGVGDLRIHMMFWLYDKNEDRFVDEQEWAAMLTQPFTNSLLAIRPGGERDVSGTHVAWKARRGVPEVPSPLYYRGRIYMIRNGGLLTCLDAGTGKEVFPPQRLASGGLYYSSPVAGDGKVYLCSDSGEVTVLKAGDTFEVLAENRLDETTRATPALVDGTIYLRTARHLYAFGEER